jgi:putative holliday junction resolvase
LGRIVALDVGDATIGIAASDELGIAAHPVKTIRRGASVKADLREVEAVLVELDASKVVVGLPLGAENEEGKQASKVKDFSDRLARRIRIPLVYWDERFSTAEAEEMMIESGMSRARRRDKIDQAAACVILEGYLRSGDASGRKASPEV